MRLPTSLTAVRGLRAARWIRESSGKQMGNYGPAAQRSHQDRAIDEYGLIDTGLEWSVAHSGRTIAKTTQFADMVDRAGGEYDVLLVAYVSRFARDLGTTINATRDVHARGGAILFIDDRLLSSD